MASVSRWTRVFKHKGCVKLGWCMTGSALNTEALTTAGFDAVVVDCQHGAAGVGSEAALNCLRTISLSNGVVPVARAPAANAGGVDAPAVGWLLDAGAQAIIAPLIHTPQQASAFVRACYFPNELHGVKGCRSWGEFSSLNRGEMTGRGVLTMAMIETDVAQDVETLDKIASTPGLDALFIGTNDLALSLGLGTSALVDRDEVILQAIENIYSAARKHALKVGLFCPPTDAGQWSMTRNGYLGGMDIVAPGADVIYLRSAAVAAAAEIR